MFFQHFSSSMDTQTSLLTLYGRTADASVAIHTKLQPTLVCGSDPRYLLDPRDMDRIEAVRAVKGNDITKWGSRVFYKLFLKDVISFYIVRKKIRGRIEIFNDQVSLPTQWFLNKRLRQCSTFNISTVPFRGKLTHCDEEYFMHHQSTITMVDKYIEPLVLSYDLECLSTDGGFPDPSKDPIICIGCHSIRESICFC